MTPDARAREIAWANMRADALEAAAQIADSFGAEDAAGTIRLLAVAPPPALPDVLAEALAAPGQRVKEGWRLVPEEPTEEMVAHVNSHCDVPDADLAWTWAHWLAAAPSLPIQENVDVG